MIFTGFKKKTNQIFLNKKFADLFKKSRTVSSKKIKKIIVFIDDVLEKEPIQKSLVTLFNTAEDNIKFVIFQQKRSKEQIIEDIVTPKDFGWYGKINSSELKSVLTKKYDLLISYSKDENLYANLVLLQCKVGFKAGFSHLDSRFYDLIINCNPTGSPFSC